MKRPWAHRILFQGFMLLLVFIFGGFTNRNQSNPFFQNQVDSQSFDLSDAILLMDDLPSGYKEMPENQKNSMKSMLDMWEGQLESSNLEMLNFTGYWTDDTENLQFIISGLVSPLSTIDRTMIDQAFAKPDLVIEQLNKMVRGENTFLLKGAENLGDSNLAFSTGITSGLTSMRLEYIVVRRGPVLVEVACLYMEDQEPIANCINLTQILDDRVASVVGREVSVAFRPTGPLIPKLTTYIPTPLDISTRPTIIGTNLLLAALLLLPFGIATEVFTRTLSVYEFSVKDWFGGILWLQHLREKVKQVVGERLAHKHKTRAVFQFFVVIIFYGLVFSLLDTSWNPFSLQGLVLFISMSIAYGLIGVAGDIIQWRVIRRWGLSADLSVRPTNLVLAIFSTTTSRLFSLVPGLMFGAPEALSVDDEQFEPSQSRRLLKINVFTFIVIGLMSWFLTAVTTILQRIRLPDTFSNAMGGLEAFLLVIFAVTLENLFVQMVGLPGGIGEALKKASRWVWLTGLLAVTFLFYHTLINPRGELARAIQTPNVQVTLGVAVIFMVIAFGLHFTIGQKTKKTVIPTTIPEPQSINQQQPSISHLPSQPFQRISAPQEIKPIPIYISIDEDKTCRVCNNQIKAEAKICRFCRARYTISLRGYCMTDHDIVEVGEGNHCIQCTGEVEDLHVKSVLERLPDDFSIPAFHPLAIPNHTQISLGMRICPSCGQTIQAEARICRFCRIRFD